MSSLAASLVARYLPESPLRHAAFRRFYAGSIGTALGWTMQTTVAAWLMATLTPSALMVAAVQTASTAPALLLGLAAGALADIVERRRIIVWTHVALVVVTAALGLGELADLVGPSWLLAGTFAVGAAFAIYLPAQQANINDIVSRGDIPRAVSLGGVAFNVARAIGPAIAGAITAALSSGGALIVASACFSAMVFAMWSARGPARLFSGLPETLWSGIQAGVRYARHSAPMRALILRNLTFSVCASALWALMPLVARDRLALGAAAYGTLMASFGVGAIAGALALPRAIGRKPLNTIVIHGTVLWALSAALVAVTTLLPLAALGAAGAGASWVTVMSCLSTATQSTAPAWVRARAVATNLVTNQAAMALGSIFWGLVAERAGVAITVGASAAALAVVLLTHRRVRVAMGEEADVTPGAKLPELEIAFEPGPEDGPVLIQIEYLIAPAHRAEFLAALQKVESIRRRNGASSWRVFHDLEQEGKYVERFVIESWAEYTRLRTRMTQADRRAQDDAERFQQPDVPIRVSRFIGVGRHEAEPRG